MSSSRRPSLVDIMLIAWKAAAWALAVLWACCRVVAMFVVLPYIDSPNLVTLQVTFRIVMSLIFENRFASSTEDSSSTHVLSFLLISQARIGELLLGSAR